MHTQDLFLFLTMNQVACLTSQIAIQIQMKRHKLDKIIHQIIIILYPKEYINIHRLTLYTKIKMWPSEPYHFSQLQSIIIYITFTSQKQQQ